MSSQVGWRPVGRTVVAITLLLLGVVGIARAAAAAGSWDHVAAVQHGPSGDVGFELWTRGDAAVLVASVDGQPVHETRCEGGRLVSHSAGSTSLVIREGLPPERCFEWATDLLLGYARAPEKLGMEPRDAAAGTDAFESPTGPIRRLVRAETGLPLSAELATGETLRWDYAEDPDGPGIPPPLDETGVLERETYRNLDPAAAEKDLGLSVVPVELAGLPLETVFSYEASTANGTAYYAIWRGDDGREIQLSVTPASAPDDMVGLLAPGTLALQEGPNQVRIVAPDGDLLRTAVVALRPGAVGELGSR